MTLTGHLTVTLEVQAWEMVMRILSEAPYRVSAPLAFVPREQPVTE